MAYILLKNFALNTIDNESGDDSGYGDYSFISTNLKAGETYNLSVISNWLPTNNLEQTAYYRLWIDYNQNSILEGNQESILFNPQNIPLTKQWDKTFGGSNEDRIVENTIQRTPDGNYILGGYSLSDISSDKSENSKGARDFWIIKIDENGNKIWDKTLGGNNGDRLFTIVPTLNQGYILGGYSNSNISGDKSENSKGSRDFWIIKIDENGNKMWDKTLGGNSLDELYSVQIMNNGSYILGGASFSNISGDKSEPNLGGADYWVIKIDENGNKEWDKTFGGDGFDYLRSVIQSDDGGYIFGGFSFSDIRLVHK